MDKRIPSLDGLRAFSILIVMMAHATWYFPAWLGTNPVFHAVVGHGASGVAVFFVISGYLITSILLKEIDRAGAINLKKFYFRRSVRIFPPFYFFLAIMVLLWAVKLIPEKPYELALSAGYLWAYYPGPGSFFIGHSWSLSIEEQFYLFWPAALSFLGISSAKLTMSLIFVMPFVRVILYFVTPSLRGHEGYMIQGWIDTVLIGCLIAILSHRIQWRSWTRWINDWSALAAFLTGFVVDPFVLEVLKKPLSGFYLLFFSFTIRAVCIGIVMIYAVQQPYSAVGRLLNLRPVRWLGTLSYSLYLWQQPFMSPDLRLLPWGFLYALVAAACSYYFIEQPFRRWRYSYESAGKVNPELRGDRISAGSSAT